MTRALRRVLCLWLLAAPACAGEFTGRVVAVADGDTLTVLDAGQRQHRVRLAEIDAPEKRQPFGQRAKQSLSDICFARVAVVADSGRDRYGRIVGRVRCAGMDANAEQVRRGMAWVYERYARDPDLWRLQEDARTARRGLWADVAPVPPWQWRAQRRRGAPRE